MIFFHFLVNTRSFQGRILPFTNIYFSLTINSLFYSQLILIKYYLILLSKYSNFFKMMIDLLSDCLVLTFTCCVTLGIYLTSLWLRVFIYKVKCSEGSAAAITVTVTVVVDTGTTPRHSARCWAQSGSSQSFLFPALAIHVSLCLHWPMTVRGWIFCRLCILSPLGKPPPHIRSTCTCPCRGPAGLLCRAVTFSRKPRARCPLSGSQALASSRWWVCPMKAWMKEWMNACGLQCDLGQSPSLGS